MSKRSAKPGKRISAAEVTNVSARGFWLLVDDRERFVDFELFPWFRDATIGALVNVRRPSPGHLHWPNLAVELELESIDQPERYPLIDSALRSVVSERGARRTAPGATAAPVKPRRAAKLRPRRARRDSG